MKHASPGSISSGTLRPEDLIPRFVSELHFHQRQNPSLPPTSEATLALESARQFIASPGNWDDEEAGYVMEDLFLALESFAPPDHYFGSHPGDGADFGFWPVETD